MWHCTLQMNQMNINYSLIGKCAGKCCGFYYVVQSSFVFRAVTIDALINALMC